MPVAELIERLEAEGLTPNQSHKALEELGLPQDGEVPSEAYEQVISHVSSPPKKQKGGSVAKRQQQSNQGKGDLTKAGEKLTNAIAKTQAKQAIEACDAAAKITAVAVLKRNSSNMNALADQILGSTGMSSEIVDRTSDEFDIDAFLGEIPSPLAGLNLG
jgi:hypothetical protein